jgi:hypothetical protein
MTFRNAVFASQETSLWVNRVISGSGLVFRFSLIGDQNARFRKPTR